MACGKQSNNARLPIARQCSTRSLENVSGKTIKPSDSISMRKATKTTAPAMTLDGTTKDSTGSVDLESQNSLQFDTKSATSSNLSNGRNSASWMARLRPSPQTIEDAVMGTSDGMTVPFALTASLAGFAPNARYVMLAGLAELTAGAISMALGGALQARCEKETYDSTVKATEATIRDTRDYVPTIVDNLFSQWNFTPETLAHISYDLSNTPIKSQTSFIVRFHHELSVPDSSRVFKSAATLGSSYFMAGFLGLLPYVIVQRTQIRQALYASIAVEAVALYVFGYAKTGISIGWTGKDNMRKAFLGALTMVLVGAIASGIAVGLITGVDRSEHIT